MEGFLLAPVTVPRSTLLAGALAITVIVYCATRMIKRDDP